MDFNDDADFEISFDGKQAEFLQLAMEDYIKERQSTYQTGFTFPSEDNDDDQDSV